ncbi:MAG: helix-turn-helix transcriptional regulator [Chitinophagaceae bacterium]
MNPVDQIFIFISAIGAFNGIILSLYFFLLKKHRSVASVLLGVMLLAISMRVAVLVLLYTKPGQPDLYSQIGLSAGFLIGPAVYYFLRSSMLKPDKGIPGSWKLVWGILTGIVLIGGLLAPYQANPVAWTHAAMYIVYLQWSAFLIAGGILLKPVIIKFFKKTTLLNQTEKFRLLILAGNCIIYLLYLIPLYRIFPGLCFSGAVSFSFILYLTSFFYLHRAKMENILQINEGPGSGTKTGKRKIADTDVLNLTGKLEKAIREKALYKDPNLKLSDVAQKINIPGHQLSLLLNDNLGKSFSTYINEFRIDEACKLISLDSRLSFEAIGYEVGYNSKSTFYTAFRKIKETTPALYKESLPNTTDK